MTRAARFLLLWTFLLGSPGLAIELSQDFDSGSLDVAHSTVSGTTVNLAGRKTWTSYPSYYRWVYFEASGVQGFTPTFNISGTTFLGGVGSGLFSLNGHRYVYSYDQENWSFFDHGTIASPTYRFYNDTPFTRDQVYIAYSLPYPLSRTEEHMSRVAASPFVTPTASDSGGLVIGHSAGGTDDLGRTISPHDLYGYTISDPTAGGEKSKVVLAGGNHPCETMGNHALEGMIDFLLSDDPIAAGLRDVADFYVYPQVNPDGRVAGYYRSTPENPSKDYNRYWNNPTGLTDMTAVRNAMLLDTGGDVDYLFDFHGMFGPWSRPDYFAVVPGDVGSDFALALADLEPTIKETPSAATAGMLRDWALSQYGLKAEHAYTAEFGARPGNLEPELDAIGANYARALYRALVPVPEPAAWLLLATGVATLTLRRRRVIMARQFARGGTRPRSTPTRIPRRIQ